jgi:hypothetical protein
MSLIMNNQEMPPLVDLIVFQRDLDGGSSTSTRPMALDGRDESV